ncbi:MAG: transposase [Thermoleophilaceae bacterium]|nr:transposase [Thermoleophilaceae bacterium]
MTLEDSIHTHRLRVLRDGERLGNVSEACRRHGMSRTLFYRLRKRFEQYGADGVHPKRRQARVGRPAAVPVQTERRVIAFALAWPTCGPQWYSDQLARDGVTLAPVTIWRLLRRQRLGTRAARLAVLEQYSATTTGLLTERTAKPTRHVEANQPGDLLSLDTFYVGKLKGVGKVWQITGCDVASSFAWARLVIGEVTAAAVLAFLREAVRPTYRQAGWRLRRVLTDNGKEFKGAFAAGCERLRIRVTRTKPRHAWTNGFVERVQKTILHEHWRIAFRRQYFTGHRMLQNSLDRFLQFYNHERTHRGYRLNGRTPATVFRGAVGA